MTLIHNLNPARGWRRFLFALWLCVTVTRHMDLACITRLWWLFKLRVCLGPRFSPGNIGWFAQLGLGLVVVGFQKRCPQVTSTQCPTGFYLHALPVGWRRDGNNRHGGGDFFMYKWQWNLRMEYLEDIHQAMKREVLKCQ
jgi:hypothetical protein